MNDIKCPHHPQQDIIYICKTCNNNQPACRKCVSTIHKAHEFIDIEDIDTTLKTEIRSNYYYNTLPQLDSILVNCKSKLEESDKRYKQIEDNHNTNFNRLELEFKSLKDIINANEYNLKRLLLTKLDENKDINAINSSIYNNAITTINNIKNDNNNNNDNNTSINISENQFIELLKRNYQCNTFTTTTTNNNNKNYGQIEEYKETLMQVKIDSIDSIKDNISMMIQISDKPKKSLKDENGAYKLIINSKIYAIFKVYECDDNIPLFPLSSNEGLQYRNLAINYGHILPSKFPSTTTSLLLPDDFDQPINSLPSHIHTLYLFNIKLQLSSGSIPDSISYIYFCDGFSQRLNNHILPRSIQYIYLGDTLHPLESSAKPVNHVDKINVEKSNSYKHNIPLFWGFSILN